MFVDEEIKIKIVKLLPQCQREWEYEPYLACTKVLKTFFLYNFFIYAAST